jgi:hypothetical protein
MEISSILSSINIIITLIVIIGATYIFLLVGLYYFSSGKTIFPFYWPGKGLRDPLARWYILFGIIFQLSLLFGLWVSPWRVEIKMIITALYVLSTTWIFYIAYKKYKLRISKIDIESNEQEPK